MIKNKHSERSVARASHRVVRRVAHLITAARFAARVIALGAALGVAAASAHAADTYPDKTIRIVVPLAPGGGTDTLARILAPKMSALLGGSMIVENRVGAGGNISTDWVAHARPDGYTVLLAINTQLTTNPAMYKHLGFDVQRDLRPVSLLATAQYVLVVRSSLPVRSVAELTAYAHAHPGQLNYSSGGIGTPLHLAGALYADMTHTQITHVPYKGGNPAVMGLLGGQVQMLFGSVADVMPHVRDGELRALAVTAPKRSPLVPEIPTLAESGLPGYSLTTWYALMVPKATPDAIVARLADAAQKAVQTPEVRKAMAQQGLEVTIENSSQLARRIKSESDFWSKLIHEMNLSAD